jgi:LCP family protein required for cell wall assembly
MRFAAWLRRSRLAALAASGRAGLGRAWVWLRRSRLGRVTASARAGLGRAWAWLRRSKLGRTVASARARITPTKGSPSLAAVLSLVPGLGHLYLGRRRLAVLFAVPLVALAVLLLYNLRQGWLVFAARFADPTYALAALPIVVLCGILWLAATSHAFWSGDRARAVLKRERGVLMALAALIIAADGFATYNLWTLYDAEGQIYSGSSDIFGNASDSLTPEFSVDEPSWAWPSGIVGTPFQSVTPRPPNPRVTILLVGVDAFVTRGQALTDTLMVLSIDPATKTVAMVSVPRDTAGYPFYWGRAVAPKLKINELATYVKHGWLASPDHDPMVTLEKEIGFLVGVNVDYYLAMDLQGFMNMIDMVGGVCINNPTVIADPVYSWLGTNRPPGFYLSEGRHCLKGDDALAYVRSRHGYRNSDWKRASRQQQVMVALFNKFKDPARLLNLPKYMNKAAKMIRTNFPSWMVADMVALYQEIPATNISSYVLGPPYSVPNANPAVGYVSCLKLDAVAPLSVKLFGDDSRYYGQTQGPTC